MQVKYFIFFMNNAMFCLLYKPSLIKNFDLSSVLPVDPVTYIMTNITCHNLHLLPGLKPVTSSSLRYIWRLCDSQDMMLERTSKSVTLGMPISCPACRACQTQLASRSACPACQTRRAKTGNELSTRREIWDLSLAGSILGCEGMNPFFPCL